MPAASSRPSRRASGCACSRRSSARPRPARARGGADAVPRLDAPSGSRPPTRTSWEEVHRRLHEWAPGAARAAASPRCRRRSRPPRSLPRAHPRRASTASAGSPTCATSASCCTPRPPPSSSGRRRCRPGCAGGSPRPGSDTGDEERSRRLESDAEAVQVLTIHRSKGLEFPIVYLPVPVGARLDPDRAAAGVLPRSRRRRRAHDRRRPRGPRLRAPPRQHMRRAARRGPAARLRRADAGAPPGGHLVGRLLGQPPLAARTAAVRARRGRQRRGRRVVHARGRRGARARFEELAGEAPGRISVERSTLGAAGRAGRPARAAGGAGGGARSTASSTCAGGERPTATSPPRPTTRASQASPRSRSSPTSPRPMRARGSPAPRRGSGLRRRRCWRRCRSACEIGTFVHRVLEATDFAADDLDAELAARIAEVQAGGRSTSATAASVVAGLRAAIETPLGAAARRRSAARRRRRRSPRRARVRAAARGRRRSRPAGSRPALIARVLRAQLAADDPLAGYAERLDDPALRAERARLSDREHRPRRAGRRRDGPRFAVARLQDELAAGPRRAADHLALPPGRAGRGDAARATMRCRRCCTSSRCTDTCAGGCPATTRAATSPACCICSCAGWSGPTRRAIDGSPCGVFAWRPPAGAGRGAERRARRGDRRERDGRSPDPFDARRAGRARRTAGRVQRRRRAHGGGRPRRDAAGATSPASDDESVLLAVAFADARAAARPRVRRPRHDPRHGGVETDEPRRPLRAALAGAGAGSSASRASGWSPSTRRRRRLARRCGWSARGCTSTATGARSASRGGPAGGSAAARRPTSTTTLLASGLARLFAGRDRRPPVPGRRVGGAAPVRGHRRRARAPARRRPSRGSSRCSPSRRARAGALLPLVALAAPTGKAAARLEEAVHDEAAALPVDRAVRERCCSACTPRRCTGCSAGDPDSHSRFRHDRANRLPHDVVIVDETSMVSLSLMARLVEAVRPDARLILVGDPGQLASIEAGAVLGDIVGPARRAARDAARPRERG